MEYELRSYMIDDTKNGDIALHAMNDIVNSVKKMQYLNFKACDRERAKIIQAARFLTRASAVGYWVEGANLQKKNDPFQWYPVQWYLFEDDAKRKMREAHKNGNGKFVYRVVNENEIIDARMTCDN